MNEPSPIAALNCPASTPPQLPPGVRYPDALAPQTNPWAIVSLASSLLAWCGLFGIGGVFGIITGIVARRQILASYGMQTGESLAILGIILGAINVLITCLFALCAFSAFSALFVVI